VGRFWIKGLEYLSTAARTFVPLPLVLLFLAVFFILAILLFLAALLLLAVLVMMDFNDPTGLDGLLSRTDNVFYFLLVGRRSLRGGGSGGGGRGGHSGGCGGRRGIG